MRFPPNRANGACSVMIDEEPNNDQDAGTPRPQAMKYFISQFPLYREPNFTVPDE
jgi:hypothetical protein